jgi:hypothetical protein
LDRFLTSSTFQHRVSVFRQEGGGFAEQPTLTLSIKIQLDRPPVNNTAMFAAYQTGALVSLGGDFDGDRRRDLLVWDRPDRLAVYLLKKGGISSEPDAAIPLRGVVRFTVMDINGDGRSDVLLRWREATSNGPVEHTRIYYSAESAR